MVKKKQNELSKVIIQNFWSIWFLVAITLILVFVEKQDTLAKFAWQKYHWPGMALLLNRSNADFAMLLGNYYFGATLGKSEYDLAKAERAFRKSVVANPKILWGHYQLARIYFIKGDSNRALEEIKKELEANPENLRSLYVRGLIYGYRNQLGDLEKAEADFRRFTQWAPKEWAGYNDLAWVLSKQGKYMEAEKTINLAFKEALSARSNSWLWNALGVAQLNLKKYASAKKSFENALILAKKLTPSDWSRSYPGNNPASAEEGLSTFLKAIGENLRRAESKSG